MRRGKNIAAFMVLLLLSAFQPVYSQGQANALIRSGIFNTPGNQPYIETSITVIGSSLASKITGVHRQNSVNIQCTIYRDSVIVKAAKYNLTGPAFDSLSPSFIDNQRYSVPNGEYRMEIAITDNCDPANKQFVYQEKLVVNFNQEQIQSSSIQPLESFKKSTTPGILTKSVYYLLPSTVIYYPDTTRELCFYYEIYNASKVLGEGKSFVYTYYLETADKKLKLNSFGSFRKEKAGAVNPILAKMDIGTLGTGNYNLVIEMYDENNHLLISKDYYFQRVNRKVDVVTLQKSSDQMNLARYFGRVNNVDTLRMFVECLWPIANGLDKERTINQSIKKDPELMKHFIVDFWQRRAADTADPVKMWAKYYQNVQQVMKLFRCGKQPGYYSERGRVYLQYGPPNQRAMQHNEQNTYPYEIWQYYRLTDATNGQFFSNRKFVFVNKNLGDQCFVLIHSDLRGEVYNPRWQFELTRRNNNGLADPDNNTPAGTQFNQFDDIYSSPR